MNLVAITGLYLNFSPNYELNHWSIGLRTTGDFGEMALYGSRPSNYYPGFSGHMRNHRLFLEL